MEFEWPEAMELVLPPEDQYDAVVLAGDIGSHTHGLEWAIRQFSKHVIYVPGNHEYYGAHIHGLRVELRKCAALYPHVHLLDDGVVELGDPATNGTEAVRFIGATLWTNFRLFGDTLAQIGCQMHDAKYGMLDFQVIRKGNGNTFEPADSVQMYNRSASFIGDELRKPFEGKTVVVTHHLPSARSVVERYRTSLLSAGFASHLDGLVERADVWVHGHTHDRLDYDLGKCRVVCHPRGYPSEQQAPYSGLIVEV
jgi:predicted phosphodiesterase